jgi:protease I
MDASLSGKRIAIVVTDGFEEAEMTEPRKALDAAGAKTVLISPNRGAVQGMRAHEKGDMFKVDLELARANPASYDALVLPGGVANQDALRVLPEMQRFVRGLYDAGKPIAAICHGPWSLIDAGVVRGKKMTSWPSLKADLTNAGAKWVDQEVVVDDGIVTSRKPEDIPAFNRELIEMIARGRACGRRIDGAGPDLFV